MSKADLQLDADLLYALLALDDAWSDQEHAAAVAAVARLEAEYARRPMTCARSRWFADYFERSSDLMERRLQKARA